jgi:hypothetical protein
MFNVAAFAVEKVIGRSAFTEKMAVSFLIRYRMNIDRCALKILPQKPNRNAQLK